MRAASPETISTSAGVYRQPSYVDPSDVELPTGTVASSTEEDVAGASESPDEGTLAAPDAFVVLTPLAAPDAFVVLPPLAAPDAFVASVPFAHARAGAHARHTATQQATSNRRAMA